MVQDLQSEKSTSRGIKRGNLLDLFLVLLLLLAALAAYFTFVQPIRFSQAIQREGVLRYAQVEAIVPEELYWIQYEVPAGEEKRNPNGDADWTVLSFEEEEWHGKKILKMTVKLLVSERSPGMFQRGNYPMARGALLQLRNSRFAFEGRIISMKLLQDPHGM